MSLRTSGALSVQGVGEPAARHAPADEMAATTTEIYSHIAPAQARRPPTGWTRRSGGDGLLCRAALLSA